MSLAGRARCESVCSGSRGVALFVALRRESQTKIDAAPVCAGHVHDPCTVSARKCTKSALALTSLFTFLAHDGIGAHAFVASLSRCSVVTEKVH